MRAAVEPVDTISTPAACEAPGELVEAGLVVDGDEGTTYGSGAHGMVAFLPVTVQPSRAIRPTTSTRSSRSAALMRSCRVSTVVVVEHVDGTACARIGAGVDAGVDDEQRAAGDLDAVGEGVGGAVHAGERRQQRRVGVDVAAAEPLEERGAGELHEARRRRRGRARTPAVASVNAASQSSRVAKSATRRTKVGTPASLGPVEREDPVAVGADGDDLGAVRRVGARVEQRLQVRARAGHEHDEAGPGGRAVGGHGCP